MQSMFVPGPAGALDVRIHGEGKPVLILHPHPVFQGTMGSRMVFDLAVALANAGFKAIRFNYRGVGRSEGSYDEGIGETADAIAVLDHLKISEAIIVGYSFGSGVAARIAVDRPDLVSKLLLVAPPPRVQTSKLDTLALADKLPPTWGIVGTMDPLVNLQDARNLFDQIVGSELVEMAGLAHFLTPAETQVVAPIIVAHLQSS